jgi:hypothetical protein
MQATPDEERAGPFPVYVPLPESPLLAIVLPGSAVVGFLLTYDPLIVHVYYEGNRYQRPDLVRFADRARFAAGRCRWMRFDPLRWVEEHPGAPPPHIEHGWLSYPTTAQTLVAAAELQHVASYDDYLGVVVPLDAAAAATLRTWIGPVDNEVADLQASGTEFERRRGVNHG